MAQLAIKGHTTRGKEVIEILEMLGGKNRHEYVADSDCFGFFIGNETTNKTIYYDWLCSFDDDDVIFTLEEFLEKFPYKLNELVLCDDGLLGIITKMEWDCEKSDMRYHISFNTHIYNKWYFSKNIKCNFIAEKDKKLAIKGNPTRGEEIPEKIKIDIPKGYELVGVDNDNKQVVFEKIGCQYPKTYEEFCNMLKATHVEWFGYYREVLVPFQKLIICRDVYWKIAGEQMGLGKPWKPDWKKQDKKYIISVFEDTVIYFENETYNHNTILAFPTEEMRDAFYEQFKDLIEQCKELL